GSGDGRDSAEIQKRSSFFQGIDNSQGMVDIARKRVPGSSFICEDMVNYELPKDLDVVFAFASILHLDKNELEVVAHKVKEALRLGGIFYISSKYRSQYEKDIKRDKYGERLFFYYTPELVEEIAGPEFRAVYKDFQTRDKTDW